MIRLRYLFLLCVMLGCNGDTKQPSHAVLVLVDFSESAIHLLPKYKQYLLEIVSKVPPGATIRMGKIQKATVAQFEPFVDEMIPPLPGLFDVEKDIEDQQRAVRQRMQHAIDSVFANPAISPGTSILAGLGLVRETLPHGQRRVLVLLSDMLNTSSDFTLERTRVTDAFIEQTVARLKSQGRIADLKGVTVYVAGATAKTDDDYRQVRKFWERIFLESGAHLKNYGHTLLDFSL